MMKWIDRYFNKEDLVNLFLAILFPLHFWAFIVGFSDFNWVTLRTTAWDAAGLVAYELLFALLESGILFICLLALAILLPTRWESQQRVAMLAGIYFVMFFWVLQPNLRDLMHNLKVRAYFLVELFVYSNPLWTLPLLLILVPVSIAYVVWRQYRSEAANKKVITFMERLQPLAYLYLFLDAVSLIIIVIRNIF